jgi:hypothetical protein
MCHSAYDPRRQGTHTTTEVPHDDMRGRHDARRIPSTLCQASRAGRLVFCPVGAAAP